MKGLDTNFKLDNGRFSFSEGEDRASNGLLMLMQFDLPRTYMPLYDAKLATLQQKPTAYLIQFRTIILSRLQYLIGMFVPDIVVTNVDIVYSFDSRKEYAIFVEHKYKPTDNEGITLTFLGNG